MRFLFLSQGKRVEDQPDFHVSFLNAVGIENYHNLPYRDLYFKGGWSLLEKVVLEENEKFKPDVVYFQFFHAPANVHPRALALSLKSTSNRPLILGSIGDPFNTGMFSSLGYPLPSSITELASVADAFLSTSMGGVAKELVRHGGKNIVFLPNAYCPEHFPFTNEKVAKEFDVVMVGRVPRCLVFHPLASIPTAWTRRYVVRKLTKAFGNGFGIFGPNWSGTSAKGEVTFKEQVAVFKKSRVVVDSPPRIPEELYSSDRAYFIAGSGSSLVMPYTPRFELLFEPGVNAYFVYHLRDVVSVCKKVLDLPEDVRAENERKTVEYIKTRNLVSHRVDTIMSVIESITRQRRGEFSADEALNHLRFSHFRPELRRSEYMPYAVVNWRG